jgi:hypothetical protein
MLKLREALEASWDSKTSHKNVAIEENPALGQCYPTSRVVQVFFPESEIAEGEVWTKSGHEKHFWNVINIDGKDHHIDFTWQQFPHGSHIIKYKIRDRKTLGDGPVTIRRVELLLNRVNQYLGI